MRAVAREQIQANQHLRPKPLLPARARGHKTRLLETACRQRELAHNRAWWNHVAGGVVKRVDLLLIEPLSNQPHVKGRVINAPAQRQFRAIIAERQHVGRDARLGHGALGEAVPVRAQARAKNEIFADRPGILRVGARLGVGKPRSEEHTSELQSHSDLVCRLLLEKKKKKKNKNYYQTK